MGLFEITGEEDLVSFQQRTDNDLYEREIEDLLWDNLQDLTGQTLFRVRRQAPITGGGVPDIVALDRAGSVVVIEVKRSVDRGQLAQCLEYAGWARTTNLQEVAGLYHLGESKFWGDWREFTETDQPVRISSSPRLVIAAGLFHDRTGSAVEFLRENHVPITVLRLRLYKDAAGRKFLDAELDDSTSDGPRSSAAVGTGSARAREYFAVSVADLIGAGLIDVGETLTWTRARSGQTVSCTVESDGRLSLPDGRVASSLSGVAGLAADGGSFDGWEVWSATARENRTMKAIRSAYLNALDQTAD